VKSRCAARRTITRRRAGLDIDYTFERDGVSETRASSHYVLTAAEIRRLLERAGFSIESIHGDMAEPTPYELGSQRLVIVARS